MLDYTIKYERDGSLNGKIEYKYDNCFNLIEKKYFDLANKLNMNINYEYDRNNRLTFSHKKSYGKWGISEPYYHYYDSTGIMTHSIWYYKKEEPYKMKKYEYEFY